jgi:excisionase family DNA binding protein
MSFEDLPDVLTIDEVAKFLRIGRNTAYELTRRWRITGGGEGLGCVPVGRGLRVPKAALERFLAGS